MEDNSNCRRPPCSPEKVREAGTVVQEALHEVEDEIPPEESQGQIGPGGPKRYLLFNSTRFKEMKQIF